TSMISLAASPGTAVEPIWSMRSADSPSVPASHSLMRSNSSGHSGRYATITISRFRFAFKLILLCRCYLVACREIEAPVVAPHEMSRRILDLAGAEQREAKFAAERVRGRIVHIGEGVQIPMLSGDPGLRDNQRRR